MHTYVKGNPRDLAPSAQRFTFITRRCRCCGKWHVNAISTLPFPFPSLAASVRCSYAVAVRERPPAPGPTHSLTQSVSRSVVARPFLATLAFPPQRRRAGGRPQQEHCSLSLSPSLRSPKYPLRMKVACVASHR